MVKEILENFLSKGVVYIPTLWFCFLFFAVFFFIFRLNIEGYFDENPNIILNLFVNQTTLVHKNRLYSAFSQLLWQQGVAKYIDSFSHADTVALLLDRGLEWIKCDYFCLLNIALNGFFLLWLQQRIVKKHFLDRKGFHCFYLFYNKKNRFYIFQWSPYYKFTNLLNN